MSPEPVQPTRITQRIAVEYSEDGRYKHTWKHDIEGGGGAHFVPSIAGADAELDVSRRAIDAWTDRLEPIIGRKDALELDRLIGFSQLDTWQTVASRVLHALFDEAGEQPAIIVRDNPSEPPARARARRAAVQLRWRGARILYAGLAVCLCSLCLGYGAALLAGRRLGR